MANRRDFLKGAAAILAAAAVIPGTAIALPASDHDKLVSLLRNGGIIQGQTFIFYRGETIELRGLSNVTIADCHFIWRNVAPERYCLYLSEGCEGCHILRNFFDKRGLTEGAPEPLYNWTVDQNGRFTVKRHAA